MTTCKHYASAALQQQYGGQDCKHHGLPYTGSNITLFVIIAIILIVAGVVLHYAGRNKPA